MEQLAQNVMKHYMDNDAGLVEQCQADYDKRGAQPSWQVRRTQWKLLSAAAEEVAPLAAAEAAAEAAKASVATPAGGSGAGGDASTTGGAGAGAGAGGDGGSTDGKPSASGASAPPS